MNTPAARRAIPLRGLIGWAAVWAILFAGGCSRDRAVSRNSENDSPQSVLTVNVMQIALSENIQEAAAYFGTLQARRSSTLGFARGGRVSKVLKDVGDQVQAGEQIAALEQRQLQSREATVNQALASAQDELSALNETFDSTLNQRQVDQLRQRIDSLESQRQEISLELQNGIVVAPYDAVIADRNVDEGDTIPTGRPAFRILEDAPPRIELDVALNIAERIKVGQVVQVIRDGSTLQARVVTKSPEVNRSSRTRTLQLNVMADNANTGWNFGEVVEIRFLIATNKSGYWLPYSALQREANGLWSAFVVVTQGEIEKVERRMLELSQLEDDFALVAGAISPDDRLIVDGSNRIVPGQRVISRDVTSQFATPGRQGARE